MQQNHHLQSHLGVPGVGAIGRAARMHLIAKRLLSYASHLSTTPDIRDILIPSYHWEKGQNIRSTPVKIGIGNQQIFRSLPVLESDPRMLSITPIVSSPARPPIRSGDAKSAVEDDFIAIGARRTGRKRLDIEFFLIKRAGDGLWVHRFARHPNPLRKVQDIERVLGYMSTQSLWDIQRHLGQTQIPHYARQPLIQEGGPFPSAQRYHRRKDGWHAVEEQVL